MRANLRIPRIFNALPMTVRTVRDVPVVNRDKGKPGRAAQQTQQQLTEAALNAGPGADWYKIVQNSADELTLYLYGAVGGGWFEEGITAEGLRNQLQEFNGHTLNVHINSPGGDVFEGIAVQNILANHSAKVHVSVDGLAASIASVIAMSGDSITMCPGAMMMIHEASGLAWGNAADMRQLADTLDKISGNLADAYARRAGGDAADWRTAMHAESWYTADEAVAAGLADKVGRAAVKPATNAEPDDGADPERPPAMDDRAEDVAARVPDHVFRFAGRQAAPAPVILPRRAPADARPAPVAEIDVAALRAAFGLPASTTNQLPALAGGIDHEGILDVFKIMKGGEG